MASFGPFFHTKSNLRGVSAEAFEHMPEEQTGREDQTDYGVTGAMKQTTVQTYS